MVSVNGPVRSSAPLMRVGSILVSAVAKAINHRTFVEQALVGALFLLLLPVFVRVYRH